MSASDTSMNDPTQAQDRQRSNVRLGLMLAVFIVVVFGITLWKFRPL